jgi:hypothetical protein
MNANEFDRLVNGVLDGSASEDERAALERHLSADPSARARLAAWEGMFATLASVPQPDVPDGLRQQILAAVRRADRPAPAWRRALESLVTRRPTMALAYAGAFGLIAGSIVSLIAIGAIGRDPRLAPTSGTMSRPATAPDAGTEVGRSTVEAGGIRFDARATRAGDEVRLVVGPDGPPPAPADLTIEFDPAELGITSVAPPEGGAALSVTSGRIEVPSFTGGRLEIRWKSRVSRPAPIHVTARAGEQQGRTTIGVAVGAGRTPPGP